MTDSEPPRKRELLQASTDRRRFVRNTGVAAFGGVAGAGLLGFGGDDAAEAPALSDAGRQALKDGLAEPQVGGVRDALSDRGYDLALGFGRSNEYETDAGPARVSTAPFAGEGEFARSDRQSEPFLSSVEVDGRRTTTVMRMRYEPSPSRVHVETLELADGSLTSGKSGTIRLSEHVGREAAVGADLAQMDTTSQGSTEIEPTDGGGGTGSGDCSSGRPNDFGCVGPYSTCCDVDWSCTAQWASILGCVGGYLACFTANVDLLGDVFDQTLCHWCDCCAVNYNCP